MFGALKKFDLYKKINSDVAESTILGGALTVLSYFTIFVLFFSSLYSYLFSDLVPTLMVEQSTSNRIQVDINIRFQDIPCALMSIAYSDISSEYFTRAVLHKYPIENGRVMYEIHMPHDAPLSPNGCGSCYGAELYEGQCCNTCEEVLEAYTSRNWKPPETEDIVQCRHKTNTIEEVLIGEGCLVEGEILTRKIPATIRFELTGYGKILMSRLSQRYTGHHTINHLGFSEPDTKKVYWKNPVDGFEVLDKDLNIYYLKVNPVIWNEEKYYEMNDGYIGFDGIAFPVLAISYDIEPITTVYKPYMSFSEFLVSLCAIIGGWHAVSIILSKVIIG